MANAPQNVSLVTKSNSVGEARDRFLGDVKAWAYACIERYKDQPPTTGHDQLTYTTGWEPYLQVSCDEHVLHFLLDVQEKTAAFFADEGLWRHGYWRMQEAHHGTEHFELFLGFMNRVAPGNPVTQRQIVDAVEHVGNWCPEVPEWFDFSTGLFRSLFFGADGARPDEHELNMPDHLRCANLLALAFEVTHDRKYLKLAESYSARWAAAICGHDQLPIGLTREGALYELSGANEDGYRSFAGMAGRLDTDLDRAENILASGGIQLFLRLWDSSRKEVFLGAVKRLLSVLVDALPDPDAGPVADAIRQYRNVTGERDYDQYVMQVVATLTPFDIHGIGVELPEKKKQRPPGVGKRSDMPVWYEDGRPRRHNPMLLATAAQIDDDPEMATRSLDLARAYFALAVRLMPDGRDHGCAARTVSAIARGHGRNNHAGMTTAVLLPIMQSRGHVWNSQPFAGLLRVFSET
ncbi:MAG: hypothetical protein K9N51_13605 [Candidatus Pacebacteria bacterium]|nr:hypothetical protein [Candidatus Paceibacterota bacterium]